MRNVDQHVQKHVMMNMIQYENSEVVQQCVDVDVFVRRVLFLKRMVHVSNPKLVVIQLMHHTKHVVHLVLERVLTRTTFSVFFHVFPVVSVTKIMYAKVMK
jgi:hypothetical protein